MSRNRGERVETKRRIAVSKLSKTFQQGRIAAVQEVSFEVYDREFVALIGPSGCGKSTVLNMIAGLIPPSGGEILINDRPAQGISPEVGYVFQKDTVFPWRTVAENIALGLEYKRLPRAVRQQKVAEMIRLAELEGFEHAFPATLSGGMRQRVALMRTLIMEPEILLMDEPFGALDTHTKLRLHQALLKLWSLHQQTVLFVTHDLNEAISLSDRVIVMTSRPGRIKTIHTISLPRPRDVIAIRETAEYAELYREIWHSLGEEFAKNGV
ncbi:MAG: ABC transporter ATP-binding protein [Nitrospinota bacterium]|nr:MAG: ABC transporter ATP-binding protein [Nitrospinota bacterium]